MPALQRDLTGFGGLLTQQLLLFGHCIESNYHLRLIFKVFKHEQLLKERIIINK